MSDLKQAIGPGGWIALVAFVVGAVVRLMKADKLNAVLAHFSIPAVPKKALPWTALALGFASTFLEAKVAGVSWGVAALAGCWGTVSGGLAVAGHEALGPLAAKFSPGVAAFVFGTKTEPQAPKPPTEGSGFGGFPLALVVLAALSLIPATAGCGAIVSALPTVIAAVQDAALILDSIESFVDRYFAKHPDPEAQEKVEASIAKTRTALGVALRASEGTEHLTQAEVDQAFAKFRTAYAELSALLQSYGIARPPGALATSHEQMVLPEPLALAIKVPE